ncbi:MAG: hypothetical protein ACLGH1_11655 [Gammaproteobacteria bacterium]
MATADAAAPETAAIVQLGGRWPFPLVDERSYYALSPHAREMVQKLMQLSIRAQAMEQPSTKEEHTAEVLHLGQRRRTRK